ncbi:MAG: DUF4126 domain-containing protein [Gemmatimonadales bacterium]
MTALVTLAQALGIAYASGISLYATVALLGIAERWGVVPALGAPLAAVGNAWIVGLAFSLTVVEFLATLIPGVASAWDAVHTFIRPPAAAAMALLVAWHASPALLLAAGMLGGTLGLATHATKLGTRVTVDASPEPMTNGMANVGELATVAFVVTAVWRHPFLTLALALAVLAGMMVLVRKVWRAILAAFRIPARTPPRR